jgi:hypothetical protein
MTAVSVGVVVAGSVTASVGASVGASVAASGYSVILHFAPSAASLELMVFLNDVSVGKCHHISHNVRHNVRHNKVSYEQTLNTLASFMKLKKINLNLIICVGSWRFICKRFNIGIDEVSPITFRHWI